VALVGTLHPVRTRIVDAPNAGARPESSDDWHWKARRVLARFGARTVPALVEALSAGDDPTVRHFAAESLGHLGDEARSASDALRHAALHDADRAVRTAAATALAAVESAGPA
jgi:HEAT repeat protein